MKSKHFYKKLLMFLGIFIFIYITGCKDNSVDPGNNEPQTDQQAFEKIADEDSLLSSFDENYNEDGLMDFLGKSAEQIYPFRFGHKAKLISRDIKYNIVADTAYATLTRIFNDTLFIAASHNPDAIHPDTIIKKGFTSTVITNLIFVRTGRSNRPYHNWRLAAASLTNGSTTPLTDIKIRKITFTLPTESIVITDPLNYFLARGIGWKHEHPVVPINADITVNVELYSTAPDTDFVTLTWGAEKNGMHREIKKFNLLTSTSSGAGFVKIYQQTYSSRMNAGFFHAVINASPRNVIFDDKTNVQNESWGFPYFVRRF